GAPRRRAAGGGADAAPLDRRGSTARTTGATRTRRASTAPAGSAAAGSLTASARSPYGPLSSRSRTGAPTLTRHVGAAQASSVQVIYLRKTVCKQPLPAGMTANSGEPSIRL